ncbi:competence protein ComEA [Bacterioplanes sanyensis]|uniref:ComEA family DNA-binding protein n=1 Tax=Bacterioplanes sanyensis TaxID=1249553 RepID=UPI0016754FEB|nr:ComEA family DNA-binding protein [Bacterioplanes sanyensis]GGY31696.1 competence protein ComEA [Bacterioplanes sanyensis]
MQWIKTALLSLLLATQLATAEPDAQPQAININTATVEQLAQLKGIGEAKAQAIVAYRQANGKFSSPEDLTKVKGIGPSTLQTNLAQLTVE